MMLIIAAQNKNIRRNDKLALEILREADIINILRMSVIEVVTVTETDRGAKVVLGSTQLLVIHLVGMISIVDVRDMRKTAAENSLVAKNRKGGAGLTKQDPESNNDLTLTYVI
jgi:hypothetical protein